MKKQTKIQELITPTSKITPPPPPPPRTHLSKDSRLKHPFKASISRLAIHRRLPWKWNTLFLLAPKANLFLTARPNSKTNGTRSLCLLRGSILIILAVIISSSCSGDSGGTETKSSQAEITELTVTINSIDYTITFDANNAATVTIPYVSTLPTEIAVKTAAISAKATGLAAGDTLKISSGKAVITVTAEDGTTTAHTLSIAINPPPMELTNQELGDRWGFFQVVLDEEDALYHFGVIPAGEPVPEKGAMESDLNVKKYTVGRNPINIILATTMDRRCFPSLTRQRTMHRHRPCGLIQSLTSMVQMSWRETMNLLQEDPYWLQKPRTKSTSSKTGEPISI